MSIGHSHVKGHNALDGMGWGEQVARTPRQGGGAATAGAPTAEPRGPTNPCEGTLCTTRTTRRPPPEKPRQRDHVPLEGPPCASHKRRHRAGGWKQLSTPWAKMDTLNSQECSSMSVSGGDKRHQWIIKTLELAPRQDTPHQIRTSLACLIPCLTDLHHKHKSTI